MFGVPALDIRYQLPQKGRAKYAIECYRLYAPRMVNSDRYDDQFEMDLKGGQFYTHFIRTAHLSTRDRFQSYIGFNYRHFLANFRL